MSSTEDQKKGVLKKTAESVSTSADTIIKQLKTGLGKIGDIGTNTKNKFINYVKDVFDVLPLLEIAGFRTNRLIVGISIPPSIEIHVSRFKELSQAEIDQLYIDYEKKSMFKLILKALLMSNDFQKKLSTDTLVFSETCIEISIPPKVSIKYLNSDIANIVKLETHFD